MTASVEQWVDSHCHIDLATAAETVAAGQAAGVAHFVTVGCDKASSAEAIAIAEQFDCVSATAGVHPHEAKYGTSGLREMLAHDDVVAVGEAGFDFHYDHSPRDAQREVFAAQVGLANELDLPLVIHTREAWEETFALLDDEGTPKRTVFHCFTGGADQARECLARGALLSISGIVTFKSAADVREAVAITPLDRLLVETDSPYLAPTPHRGKPNQPAFVGLVGAKVAEVTGRTVAEIAQVTSTNAMKFFGDLSTQS